MSAETRAAVEVAREERDAARRAFREVWASGAPAAAAAARESAAQTALNIARLEHQRAERNP